MYFKTGERGTKAKNSPAFLPLRPSLGICRVLPERLTRLRPTLHVSRARLWARSWDGGSGKVLSSELLSAACPAHSEHQPHWHATPTAMPSLPGHPETAQGARMSPLSLKLLLAVIPNSETSVSTPLLTSVTVQIRHQHLKHTAALLESSLLPRLPRCWANTHNRCSMNRMETTAQ